MQTFKQKYQYQLVVANTSQTATGRSFAHTLDQVKINSGETVKRQVKLSFKPTKQYLESDEVACNTDCDFNVAEMLVKIYIGIIL